MWKGHEYFMEKQPKTKTKTEKKEKLKNVYILSTIKVKGSKNS